MASVFAPGGVFHWLTSWFWVYRYPQNVSWIFIDGKKECAGQVESVFVPINHPQARRMYSVMAQFNSTLMSFSLHGHRIGRCQTEIRTRSPIPSELLFTLVPRHEF